MSSRDKPAFQVLTTGEFVLYQNGCNLLHIEVPHFALVKIFVSARRQFLGRFVSASARALELRLTQLRKKKQPRTVA